MEDSLSALARKHDTTRFIKLSYEEADLDVMTVPAVLAYKGGELIANLVSVIDQIPPDRDMSAASMELLLQQYLFPANRSTLFTTNIPCRNKVLF